MDLLKKSNDLFIAKKEIFLQNEEIKTLLDELVIANKELALQNEDKEKRAAELLIANKELDFQNIEKERRAEEAIKAHNELAVQHEAARIRELQLAKSNSELGIIEEQLRVANEELEAFSYSVSHDLRAPLRAISGFSNMLKEDFSAILNTEGNRIIDVITDKTRIMGELIDDLLVFSKMSRLEVVNESINAKKLVEKCVYEALQAEKKSVYEVRIGEIPTCKGDQGMLKQVWYNLVSNAIKYSSKKEKPQIIIGARDEADKNVYFIKDNGAGFEMKYTRKLFGVFQRLHRQEEFEGTGIGLALVKRIIRKHGGEVWAESVVNEGSTFYFSLPK